MMNRTIERMMSEIGDRACLASNLESLIEETYQAMCGNDSGQHPTALEKAEFLRDVAVANEAEQERSQAVMMEKVRQWEELGCPADFNFA